MAGSGMGCGSSDKGNGAALEVHRLGEFVPKYRAPAHRGQKTKAIAKRRKARKAAKQR
jgi:hypothetical protein